VQRVVTSLVVVLLVFGAGVAVGLRLGEPADPGGVDPDVVALEPGSRADPIRPGEPGEVGGWSLRVVGVDRDGEDRVLAANQFNQAAPDDHSYVLVEVALERRAAGPGVVRGTLTAALASAGERVWALGQDCGVVPDALDAGQPVGRGAEVRGTWCWAVPDADLPKLRLRVGGPDGREVWFALQP
jgi:hypothetical protein